MKHNYKTNQPKKISTRSSRRRKNCKAGKWHEKWQTMQNDKEELRKTQYSQNSKLPLKQLLTLSMQALPLR
jgi:hypothetical protein